MRRAGFTLFEVVVALALIMALLGTTTAFLYDLTGTRRQVLERTAQQRAGAILVDRLERDLAGCVVGDSRHGSGVSGDGRTLRLLTRAVPAWLAERGAEDPTVLGDLERVEYRFDERARQIEARRLLPGDTGQTGLAFETFGGTVHRLRFRFYDGSSWRDRFDSLEEDQLPVAVEVALWFHPDPGDEDEVDPEDGPEDEPDLDLDLAGAEPLVEDDETPPPDRIRVIIVPDATAEP